MVGTLWLIQILPLCRSTETVGAESVKKFYHFITDKSLDI